MARLVPERDRPLGSPSSFPSSATHRSPDAALRLIVPLYLESLPLLLLLAALVAAALPIRWRAGGGSRRLAGDVSHGLLRAEVTPVLALELLVVCQVTGAALPGYVAGQVAAKIDAERQRGPAHDS